MLARDRLGVKPLYYAPCPDVVLFGSEPKAILAHPDDLATRSPPSETCSPTDHRLVDYVWNVPWPMKEADGVEKGLLRPGLQAVQPSPTAPAAFLLDINKWLRRYHVSIV